MRAVIGGGISGLIWCLYNPRYLLFAEMLGGQLSNSWTGPRLLHDGSNNRRLLRDLRIPIREADCRVGYFIEGKVVGRCPNELRVMYYKKSRGLSGPTEVPDSVMSEGSNLIHHLVVNWPDLMDRLKAKVRNWIREDVRSIRDGIINDKKHGQCEHLIWTPPLPILFKVLNIPIPPLEASDKRFVKVENFRDFDLNDFDYVYIPGPEFDYHRVTKVPKGIVLEWTGPEPDPDLSRYDVIRDRMLKGVQIVPSEINPYSCGIPEYIKLFGRFAEWKHRIKIGDTVNTAVRFKGRNRSGPTLTT